jgi:hypothetical protein
MFARLLATARRSVLLGVVGLMAALWTVLFAGSPFTLALLGRSTGSVPLGDFGSFYASGQAAAQGLDPFDVYPLTMDANLGRGHGAAVNLNAPLSVVLFQPLAGLDVSAARLGWFVATLVAYAVMVISLWRAYPAVRAPFYVLWPLAMAGFWDTVNLGQVYVFLALPTTIAWLLLARRPAAAGLLLGAVVAIKPNFLIWPLLLLLSGERRASLVAFASAAVFALLPVALYGPRVYAEWLAAVTQAGVNPEVANASIGGALARLGAPPQLGVAASGLVLIAAGAWVWTHRPTFATTSGIAIVVLLLCSPLAWVGYSTFLLPLVFERRMTYTLGLGALLLCIPRLVLEDWASVSPLLRMSVGSAYLIAWGLVLYQYLAPRLIESVAPAHVAQW